LLLQDLRQSRGKQLIMMYDPIYGDTIERSGRATNGSKIGRLAVCNVGRIGVVEKIANGVASGIGLLDGKPWQSKVPRYLNKSEQRLILECLEYSSRYKGLCK